MDGRCSLNSVEFGRSSNQIDATLEFACWFQPHSTALLCLVPTLRFDNRNPTLMMIDAGEHKRRLKLSVITMQSPNMNDLQAPADGLMADKRSLSLWTTSAIPQTTPSVPASVHLPEHPAYADAFGPSPPGMSCDDRRHQASAPLAGLLAVQSACRLTIAMFDPLMSVLPSGLGMMPSVETWLFGWERWSRQDWRGRGIDVGDGERIVVAGGERFARRVRKV